MVSIDGGTPKSSILVKVFHYEPFIWGYPIFVETGQPNPGDLSTGRHEKSVGQLPVGTGQSAGVHQRLHHLQQQPPHLSCGWWWLPELSPWNGEILRNKNMN